jgi:suppressor of G2 allele of SKP1
MPDGKLKYDWYQSDSHVTVAVMIRNLVKEETQIEFGENSATALLKLPDGSDYKLQLVLHQAIVPGSSTYSITPSKLELKMAKASGVRWLKLEADPNQEAEQAVNSLPMSVEVIADAVPSDGNAGSEDGLVEAVASAAQSIATDGESASQPNESNVVGDSNGLSTSRPEGEDSNGMTTTTTTTSSGAVKEKGPKNWDKIVKEFEEEEEKSGEKDVNDLFKQIYSQGNEEMRRAMNKSFSESGGTVLSTNWDEVSKDKVTVKPPDDCEFKKWD